MKNHTVNLNYSLIAVADGDGDDQSLIDPAATSTAKTSVFFRDLESRLIHEIEHCDFIVGCVAWLTKDSIIAALAKVPYGVSIIVQKEDFLRPDLNNNLPSLAAQLRRHYESLRCQFHRYEIPGMVGRLSICGDCNLEPIRCVGNHNAAKWPAFPRMHHKFLVFCSVPRYSNGTGQSKIVPLRVWTGSFNLTKNSANSLENAVLINSHVLARSYFEEWQQIAALSEQLDWTSEWTAPEWRIGT
ncbi:MAG: hypothetical protein ACREFF_11270 [Candidatus Udaeobacter sp.]